MFALFGHCCGQIKGHGRRALVVDMFLNADAIHSRCQVAGGNLHLKQIGGRLGGSYHRIRVRVVANVAMRHTLRVHDLSVDAQDDAVVRTHLDGEGRIGGDGAQVDVTREVVRDGAILLGDVQASGRVRVSPSDGACTARPVRQGCGRCCLL